ncbi:MAG: hypothetical protein EBZ77_13210, partial [Chitinophagia bacterium]|nr:hypothetical protein [Chitinophagia bacterium]
MTCGLGAHAVDRVLGQRSLCVIARTTQRNIKRGGSTFERVQGIGSGIVDVLKQPHHGAVIQTEIHGAVILFFNAHRQRLIPLLENIVELHLKGERVLTKEAIATLEKWAADGAPEGPKDKQPPLPTYPVGSLIGIPDMRIPLKPFLIKANTADQFLLVKVPYELPKDSYAAVIEYMPGSAGIVHHVNGDLVKYEFDKKKNVFSGEYMVNTEKDTAHLVSAFEKLGLPNDDGTYPVLQKSVVNYLPGAEGQRYPDGIGGYLLPRKGVFLLNDLHYGFTTKKDVIDSSYINIFFTKTPPARPVREFQMGTLGAVPVEPDLVIQPDAEKTVMSRMVIKEDISILTINPHMHLLGKSFKAYAVPPQGDTIHLISIPRWDFNWQYFYTFTTMVK